jgi:hypothetical protein
MILTHWLVFVKSVKQTSNCRWNQWIDFSSCVCCTAKCRCCQCYLSLTVKKSHGWSNLFSSMKSPFCLWWGLTGYRPTGSETRNDGRSSSENNARLKDESSCDTSARFAFPSITGNKMSFPSFHSRTFVALSLSLPLSLTLSLFAPALALALWLWEAFSCVQFWRPQWSNFLLVLLLSLDLTRWILAESFCSSFCLLFTFALLCFFFL